MNKKISVLYVEDEKINRSLFSLLFSRWYHVLIAEDAGEAWQHIKENKIDIIFSDQKLTEALGTDLLREIHKTYEYIPKYIVTGYLESEEIKNAAANGVILGVIHKPFNHSDLRLIIESHTKDL